MRCVRACVHVCVCVFTSERAIIDDNNINVIIISHCNNHAASFQ